MKHFALMVFFFLSQISINLITINDVKINYFLVYMVVVLLILAIFTTIVFMSPWENLSEFFQVEPWDTDMKKNHFRIYLLLIPVIHLMIAVAIEV